MSAVDPWRWLVSSWGRCPAPTLACDVSGSSRQWANALHLMEV
jgi:hypothetical protein